MSEMWCKACKRYRGSFPHVCPPVWRAWDADPDDPDTDPENFRTAYASNGGDAAAEFVRQNWEDASDGADYTVAVRCEGTDEIERYLVSAELVMTYTARRLEDRP